MVNKTNLKVSEVKKPVALQTVKNADAFHVIFSTNTSVYLNFLNTGHGDYIAELGFGRKEPVYTTHLSFNKTTELVNFLFENTDSLIMKHEIQEMKGFNSVVYGRKTAKAIKKNPRKTGKKMAKAYRGMI